VTVDLENEEGTVSYLVSGQRRAWDLEVQAEWADQMVLSHVLVDLVSPEADVATFHETRPLASWSIPASGNRSRNSWTPGSAAEARGLSERLRRCLRDTHCTGWPAI
jgi:hypothetical protein